MAVNKDNEVTKRIEKKAPKYVAMELFKDTDGVVYNTGDNYPDAKSKPTQARIKALATEDNKYNRPFIKEV